MAILKKSSWQLEATDFSFMEVQSNFCAKTIPHSFKKAVPHVLWVYGNNRITLSQKILKILFPFAFEAKKQTHSTLN